MLIRFKLAEDRIEAYMKKQIDMSEEIQRSNITSTYHSVSGNGISRNLGIDILKMICSFLVVYIHAPMPGMIGEAIYMVSRVAVPVFFIITGFFYLDTVQNGKTFLQIRKIFQLFLISNGIFFLKELAAAWTPRESLHSFIVNLIHIQTIKDFFVFNASPFCYHLWYMGAILYTLMIMAWVYRPGTKKYLWACIPALLAIDLLFGDYSVIVFGKTFPVHYVRNFLCVGIPYFLIGTIIREYYAMIKEKTTAWFWWLCSVCLLILTVAERYILVINDIAGRRKHNISTTLFAIAIFILSVLLFENKKQNRLTTFLSALSRRYSAWIYIIHPLFVTAFGVIAKVLKVKTYYAYVRCVVVYIGTICFLIVADKMYQKLFKKQKESKGLTQ